MNTKTYITALICIICAVYACTEARHSEARICETVSNTQSSDYCADTLLFHECMEIHLQDSVREAFVSRIDRLIITGDTLYITDTKQRSVVAFNTKGEYLFRINHRGHGNKEYTDLIDVAYDKWKHELLFLVYPKAIFHYTPDGRHIRTTPVEEAYTDICADSTFYYLAEETYTNGIMTDKALAIMNKNSLNITRTIDIEHEQAPFCSLGRKLYSGVGDRIWFTRKFDYTLYSFSNGIALSDVIVNYGSREMGCQDRSTRWDCMELARYANENNYVYGMHNICDGQHTMVFSTNQNDINVMDKKKHSSISYRGIVQSTYGTQLRHYAVIDGSDAKCVFFFWPEEYDSARRSLRENPDITMKVSTEYLRLLATTDGRHNPVLFIYTPR
ncbi:MAG: 6-bladed beta-propeller [Bacteroidaceae bacterium]|nr:6-bladed beta-propeller [Bacteroidaceae bacterium]